MLTLALLRHAKSSWDEPGLDDFDRPLNDRGETAAPVVGGALAETGFRADLILCSPATRTRQTLERAAPAFVGPAARLVYDERLYLASAAEILRIIGATALGPQSLLVIGHNPGLHTLALNLAGVGSAADIGRLTDKFPTAGLVLLTFETSVWGEVRAGDGRLEAFITPKSLR